jgi:hypothetical protein
MNEQECLSRMIAPGQIRPSKPYRGGVIQVLITSRCDKACLNCTQNSQFVHSPDDDMTLENVEKALLSLKGYFGVVGCFGGNPAMHRQFQEVCELWRKHVPAMQRGIWCNHPLTLANAQEMAKTFDPSISNLNVHLDRKAHDLFKAGWPNCFVVGLDRDSRHSPCLTSMQDLGVPEEERWELISRCDINQHWSAMIGQFRGQVRAWFCEVAGAQAIFHQHDPMYPDSGRDLLFPARPTEGLSEVKWWQLEMGDYADQVRQHCHDCGVPLRGFGELAQTKDPDAKNQVTTTHHILRLIKGDGAGDKIDVLLSTDRLKLREQSLTKTTQYLQNAAK